MASKLDKQLAKVMKKARAHLKKGHLEKGLLSLREAAELARYDQDIWAERAQLAEQLGEVDEAADSYFHIADMYARSGRAEQAADLVRRVLELNPKHGGARSFRRLLHMDDVAAAVPERSVMPPPRAEPEALSPPPFSPAPEANLDHEPPNDLQPVIEFEAIEPHPHEVFDDDDDEDQDTQIPRTEQKKAELARLLEASADQDEVVPTTQVRRPDVTVEGEVPAVEDQTYPPISGRGDLLAEAAPDDSDSVIPGRINDEWRDLRRNPSEHRISHHSAQLAVTDVINVSAQDPGDVPEPEVDLDIVDAVAETIPISPLLSELDSDLVKYLIDNSHLRHKSPGQAVFTEGDEGSNLCLILRGEVVVERRMIGDEVQRVATLRPGAFFGEMALLTDAPRSATVRAVSMLSFLDIPRDTVRHIVDKQSRVRKLLMRFFRARMVGSLMVSSDLFRPFSVEDRRKLVTRFRLRELPPGQVVLEQGQRSDGLYLVLAGTVELFRPQDDQVIAELGAGEVFGEVSLLEDAETAQSVRAKTRGWVLRLPRDDFKELIASYPKVLERLNRLAKERKAKTAKAVGRQQSSA